MKREWDVLSLFGWTYSQVFHYMVQGVQKGSFQKGKEWRYSREKQRQAAELRKCCLILHMSSLGRLPLLGWAPPIWKLSSLSWSPSHTTENWAKKRKRHKAAAQGLIHHKLHHFLLRVQPCPNNSEIKKIKKLKAQGHQNQINNRGGSYLAIN